LTTAGVTRAATASTALSSATSEDTLESSNGPAAAAIALLWSKKNVTTKKTTARIPAGTAIFFTFATNELVVIDIMISIGIEISG
jgi:hypothetical protein